MKFMFLVILFQLGIFSVYCDAKKDFWSWILENESKISTNYPNQEISNQIYQHLIKYNPNLAVVFPSFGGKPKEIVISCSGNPSNRKSVDDLFENRPDFKQIIVTKFIQPQMAFEPLQILGRVVPLENIGVMAEKSGNGYILTIYSGKFSNLDPNQIGNDLFNFFLFQFGEERYMDKIKDVNIQPVSLMSPEIFPFTELRSRLE